MISLSFDQKAIIDRLNKERQKQITDCMKKYNVDYLTACEIVERSNTLYKIEEDGR